jgi:microcompartment protein CcmK/EutM
MGFWNKMFPYSNVHELNLDWLISKMKELEEALKTAVGKITGSVRYDEYQGLSDPEAKQARTNIKAAGAEDVRLQIKNTAVMYSETQTLQADAQERARKNIGAIEQNEAVSPNIAQELTDNQKAQARSNIQAQSPQEALNQGRLNFVQFSAAQSLTETQKKQARDNIGAGTGGGGDPEGAVLYSKAQSLEDSQKYQARQNIDAVSTQYVNDNFVAAYQEQTLTPAFKANARGNIAAVSYEAQTLTSEQQAQARANIGAGTGSGSVEGAVRYDAEQNLTEQQKKQARDNIGAGTGSLEGYVRYDVTQTLDTTQQEMARSNIGAAASADITANAVSYDAQSGFTNLQREQACENIGAVTYSMDQILNDTEKEQARKNIGATNAKYIEVVKKVTLVPATTTKIVNINLNPNKVNLVLVEGDSNAQFEIALIEGDFDYTYSQLSTRPSCFVMLPTGSEVSETTLKARVFMSVVNEAITVTIRIRTVEFNN